MDPFAVARAQLASGHDPAAVLRQLLASHGAMPHQAPHGMPPGLPNGAPLGPPGPMAGPPMGAPPPALMGR